MNKKVFYCVVLLGSFITSSIAQVNLNSQLHICYPFDGNANDYSGLFNHGTITGAVATSDRFANPAGALSFNGSNNFVRINNVLPDMSRFTISVWVYNTKASGLSALFCDADQVGYNDVWMSMQNSGLEIIADKPGGTLMAYGAVTGQNLNNAWHHIVWVCDNVSQQVYIDTILKANLNISGTNIGYHNPQASIGQQGDAAANIGYYNFFQGKIDDFRLYTRAINFQEIKALFFGASCGAPVSISANFNSSDTVICKGSCIDFTDFSTGPVLNWNWNFIGATTSSSTVKNPSNICYPNAGIFPVKLIVSNGTVNDTIIKNIQVTSTASVSAGSNVTITAGSSTTLNASGSFAAYNWLPATGLSDPNSQNPVANPSVTTTYYLFVANGTNCTATSSVTVFVGDTNTLTITNGCGDVFVPTAFSPNGDGENDLQCVMGNCIETMRLTIYNRWGEKVFESDDPKKCWDGALQGKAMDTGIFVYHLTATFKSGESVEKKGNIHLIR
jgi:gliding motility-associated-like protein